MVVPSGAGAGSVCPGTPPERVSRAPCSDPVSQLMISIWLTAAMAARASPRKPRVPMRLRSSAVRSLEVAWRRKAVGSSAGAMPQPLSVTRMSFMPPPRISTVTALAPASRAFSTSSFTTLAGRSTTSPAAMSSETSRGISWIWGMGTPPFRNGKMRIEGLTES